MKRNVSVGVRSRIPLRASALHESVLWPEKNRKIDSCIVDVHHVLPRPRDKVIYDSFTVCLVYKQQAAM